MLRKVIQKFPNLVIPTLQWLKVTDVTKTAETTIIAARLQICAIFQLALISLAIILTIDLNRSCHWPASRIQGRLHTEMKCWCFSLASWRKRSPNPRVNIRNKGSGVRLWGWSIFHCWWRCRWQEGWYKNMMHHTSNTIHYHTLLGGKPTLLDIVSKPCHTATIISSLQPHNNNNQSCLDPPSAPKRISRQTVLFQHIWLTFIVYLYSINVTVAIGFKD